MIRLFLILSILVTSIIACNTQKKEENKKYLPKASGKPGDMIIFFDSMQWKGPLGDAVKDVFRAPVPGLPQEEPMFKAVFVQPSDGLTMLKQIRNLVYVFTLDKKTNGSRRLQRDFTPESIAKIKADTSFHLTTTRDEYSKGQEVMYLFANTEKELIDYLAKNKQTLIDHFNEIERRRLQAALLNVKSTKGLTEFLRKEQQCEIRVPVGYRLADKNSEFVWLRQIDSNMDKDVLITWKPYVSEYQLLPDSIIHWRGEVAKKYLFGDPEKPDTYLVTETENAKVHARQTRLRNNFAMEVRGLWRTNTRSMGGPFVGYALVDQPRGLIYYIEGFTYAPGKDKREIIRELETILWTFRTSNELSAAK